MRLAILSRTLMLLALPAVLVTCAAAQDHPNVQPSNVLDQLNKLPAPSQAASAPVTRKAPVSMKQPKAPASSLTTATCAATPYASKSPTSPKAPARTAGKKAAKPPVEK